MRYQAPKGTADALPADAAARDGVVQTFGALATAYGYGRIETPAFEDTAVFERGVGEATDIVHKEMYTFEDRGGRSLTLRPEGTAPVCRAYVEHGMAREPQPVKLWYASPMWRYERMQRGRYRQFHQFGSEALGSDDPLLDVETICLLIDTLARLGLEDLRVRLNTLGDPSDRAAYRDALVAHVRPRADRLHPDARRRLDQNPLRLLDDADPDVRAVVADAPPVGAFVGEAAAAHHAVVREGLAACGVDAVDDPTLVRGLDYYTRTLFEVEATTGDLGAQSSVGGGGRYDGLVEALGGPPTPGVGFAAGIERILLAGARRPSGDGLDAYVLAEDDRVAAFALTRRLRQVGLAADMDFAARSAKGQRRQADRRRARFVLSAAPDGVVVDDRAAGRSETLPSEEVETWLLKHRVGG